MALKCYEVNPKKQCFYKLRLKVSTALCSVFFAKSVETDSFVLIVIYQTRVTVFHRDIQTPRRELKIRHAAHATETKETNISNRQFDIFSQFNQKLKSKQ